MKKYLLIMLMALFFGAVSEPASARVRVVVRHGFVAENVIVEEYPEYYVSQRVNRQYRNRCHYCQYRPRSQHRVRYYYEPDYVYSPAPQPEVVVYQEEYYWNW